MNKESNLVMNDQANSLSLKVTETFLSSNFICISQKFLAKFLLLLPNSQ